MFMAALFKRSYRGGREYSSSGGFMKNDDLGKLLLRLSVGGLMLFHGIHKLIHGHGFIVAKLRAAGLPELLVAGVPIGEVIAPLLVLVGFYTRPAALVEALLMAMAIWLVHMGDIFSVNAMGGYALELQVFYLFGSLAIMLLGAGRYSVSGGTGRWN